MTTKTYSDLLSTIKSLCGVEFATIELARINTLVNRRAKRAYKASNNWPRFIVVGENKNTSSSGKVVGYLATIPVPVTASSLSTATVTVQSVPTGVVVGGTLLGQVISTIVGTTITLAGNANAAISTLTLSPYTPTAASTVGIFLKINAVAPFTTSSPQDINFHVDSAGANLIISTAPASVFVTYKKVLSDTYGDTTGLVADVPSEWFDYIAHGVYADYLRAEGQQDKSQLADQEASIILDDELIQVDQQGAGMTFGARYLTNTAGNNGANNVLRRSQG